MDGGLIERNFPSQYRINSGSVESLLVRGASYGLGGTYSPAVHVFTQEVNRHRVHQNGLKHRATVIQGLTKANLTPTVY